MPRPRLLDREVLEAALEGLQNRLAAVEHKIAQVKAALRSRGPRPRAAATSAETAPAPRRKMSASARRRIAEAQKRRWAEFRAKENAGRKKGARKSPPSESQG